MKKMIKAVLLSFIFLTGVSCAARHSEELENETEARVETPTPEAEENHEPPVSEPPDILPDGDVYILGDGVTGSMIRVSQFNPGNRERLSAKLERAGAAESFTVAFIGGSITQGSSAGENQCYAKLIANWFDEHFPDTQIQYVNAGIGATGSYIGVHRVDADVLANAPDIVFVEFSVNDTTENTQRNINAYDSLLRKLWFGDSAPAVVCVATTMENGWSFQKYHADTALAYDLPFISYGDAIHHVIKAGQILWKDISGDDIHPNVNGHKIMAELVIAYLEDVIANHPAAGGGENESDFSVPHTEDKYKNARLIRQGGAEVVSTGFFAETAGNFGGFKGTWSGTAAGALPEDAALVFQVEAQNIAVLYGKLRKNAGRFDIFVDGELIKTLNAAFPNGWGDYVEVEEIISFPEAGVHTVEIVPVVTGAEGDTTFVISSLAVS